MSAAAPPTDFYSPGLEGVIAGETAISTVEGGLRYRGYPIGELAEHCAFEEVAHLLLHGELPTAAQLQSFTARIAEARTIPAPLVSLLQSLPPDVAPMDVVRTAVSVCAHFDPDTGDNSQAANLRKAERLLGQIPVAVAYHFHISQGLPPVPPDPRLPLATDFLRMIRGGALPSPAEARAFEVSLTLYAEHEFNASTFTSRVVVSTLADLHSGIVAAIGALKGPLHGGANEKVMDVLREAGGPTTAEAWLRDALARKARIMGFGHRVYKAGDVRAGILKEVTRKLIAASPRRAEFEPWETTADIIETGMAAAKNMFPNLDWPAGRLYHVLGLAVPLYTPIFVMSRITGWSAHIIEQLANNRLIRPRAKYTGPDLRGVPRERG